IAHAQIQGQARMDLPSVLHEQRPVVIAVAATELRGSDRKLQSATTRSDRSWRRNGVAGRIRRTGEQALRKYCRLEDVQIAQNEVVQPASFIAAAAQGFH